MVPVGVAGSLTCCECVVLSGCVVGIVCVVGSVRGGGVNGYACLDVEGSGVGVWGGGRGVISALITIRAT